MQLKFLFIIKKKIFLKVPVFSFFTGFYPFIAWFFSAFPDFSGVFHRKKGGGYIPALISVDTKVNPI